MQATCVPNINRRHFLNREEKGKGKRSLWMLTMSARALATAASLGGRLMVNVLHGGEGEKYFENTECERHHHIDHGTKLEASVWKATERAVRAPATECLLARPFHLIRRVVTLLTSLVHPKHAQSGTSRLGKTRPACCPAVLKLPCKASLDALAINYGKAIML
jgi:hypothetical protein